MLDLEVWDTSGQERFKPLSLAFFRNAACVILVFDVRDRRTFDSLERIGGWRDEFTRMTGATPKTFPFILVGNKIESDIQKPRQVWEDDVRDWCAREGGVLPFVETSFSGDPQDAYKYAARVFGVVSRVAVGMEEAFGSYEAPDTVRVHHEDEDQEEEGAIGRSMKNLFRSGSTKALAKEAGDVADRVGKQLRLIAKEPTRLLPDSLKEVLKERNILPAEEEEEAAPETPEPRNLRRTQWGTIVPSSGGFNEGKE